VTRNDDDDNNNNYYYYSAVDATHKNEELNGIIIILKARDHFAVLSVDGRNKLKCIFKK
jgi:hypothetical protein